MYHGCLRNVKGPCVIILMTTPPHVNSMKLTSKPDRTDGGVRAGEESEGAPLSRRQCLIMPSISEVIASEDDMMSAT